MAAFLGSRVLLGAFLLLTCTYCLLLYIPFTYFGFIRHPLLWWLPIFVKIHPYLYAALLGLVGATLLPELRGKQTRASAAGFLLLNAFFCVYMTFDHGLASLSPYFFSYLWSMFAVFPLIWLAAIDMAGDDDNTWKNPNPQRNLDVGTTAFAALAVASVFAATAALRQGLQGSAVPKGRSLREWGVSLALHLIIFSCYGLVVCVLKVVARKTPWPAQAGFVLTRLLACLLCAQALRTMILPAISFEGAQADVFCLVVAFAFTIYVSGIVGKFRSLWGVGRVAIAPRPSAWLLGLAGIAVCGVAYAIPVLIGPTDWDFVLQKSAVLLVWSAVIAFLSWTGLGLRRWRTPGLVIIALLVLTGLGSTVFGSPSARRAVLDDYAGSDISLKTASAIFSRSLRNDAYEGFYDFLRHKTNLQQPINPVDLSLGGNLKPYAGSKPNIFLFVIDSLRQDYVSAYNPAVSFTPEIGKFASDSVVLQNAFTRYAGTALSEPAIWVGVMQMHKQYIEPFYPMNNLQRLLEAEGYQSYISIDPILQQILRPSASITELDKDLKVMSDFDLDAATKKPGQKTGAPSGKSTKNWSLLDFVATLAELESSIDGRAYKSRPIFAYTQPQNIHTLTLEQSRRGGSREEISRAELERMDAAFGAFLQFLVTRHLYDNSIIIITSDHGDYYGEFGRWGHADFLFPQVIRIPLIVHLPPALRSRLHWDVQQIAFSMDITPSLYYLLGQRPTVDKELFGRPLFTETIQEQTAYVRPYYLIASSYAPVYGLLGRGGQELFIVDAVNRKNYYYDLSEDPQGVHNRVTPEIVDKNEALIRGQIGLIDALYGVAH